MSKVSIDPTTDRENSERVARCVATMVYYHKDGWSWSGAKLLAEEAGLLLDWATTRVLDERTMASILAALDRELSDRFGPEIGTRLSREFARALTVARVTDS